MVILAWSYLLLESLSVTAMRYIHTTPNWEKETTDRTATSGRLHAGYYYIIASITWVKVIDQRYSQVSSPEYKFRKPCQFYIEHTQSIIILLMKLDNFNGRGRNWALNYIYLKNKQILKTMSIPCIKYRKI